MLYYAQAMLCRPLMATYSSTGKPKEAPYACHTQANIWVMHLNQSAGMQKYLEHATTQFVSTCLKCYGVAQVP